MSGSNTHSKTPSKSSSSPSRSNPSSGAIKKREKWSIALYLKQEISKANRPKKLPDHLEYLLDPQRPIDDSDNIDSYKWIIAGGLTFEDFGKKVREYDSSVMCGLVWTANFVAYRCRTCGISPCMSICSDCFQAGNHEGHDYNMFRSHSGGACDCGDASVMKPEGFCCRHGESNSSKAHPEAPADLMAMAKEMMPLLFLRLLFYFREYFERQVRESSSTFIWRSAELEQYLTFLQSLSDMGAAMRRVMAEAFVDTEAYKKSTLELKPDSKEHKTYSVFLEHLNSHGLRYPPNFDKYKDRPGMNQKLEYSTIIEELLFWVLRFEFPEQFVTFLLGLLPDDMYKESFAMAFVKHYSRVSIVLMEAKDRVMVANRFVHISVQLFSNEKLAVFLTEHHNLLLTIILSLANMMQSIQVASLLEDPDMKSNFHCVVNCDQEIMRDHCYWPVVSDLINVLSHRKIAHSFLKNQDLVVLWLDLLNTMQGMNLNTRELRQHVEFEPDSYYAAFSAELEMSASPMWSLLMHCQTPDTRNYIMDAIQAIKGALQDWFEAINFKDTMKPNPYQLTFHLPLHRYLAMFIMVAIKSHDADLMSLLPEESLLKQIMMHPLQIQVCLAQIYAGMWVRNGIQIKGQAMTYIQCHFCYSMSDADLYLLQLCAIKLDPDYFVTTVLERFRIMDWLSYCPEIASASSLVDSDHKLAMVEGALSLFSALLGIQTYLGIDEPDLVRKEMASLLCMNDRQHSNLMDLMPEKTGVSGLAKELFEPTLKELADYKAPNFEAGGGGLQQGTYIPKDSVWAKHFDPVHVSQRAIYRKDMQAAMDRYTEHIKSKKNYKKTTNMWPPFKINDSVHNSYRGIYRIVNCKTIHAFLFSVLHKALSKDRNVPESILYHAIHLLNLCLHFAPKTFPNRVPGLSLQVHDSQLDRWFGTSDIKANACDIISEVIVPTPVTEAEIRSSGSSVDMDSSSLEEMFQIQPSTLSSSGGPITSAQLGQIPPLAMVSLPSVASGGGGAGITSNFALGIPVPHPPTAGTKPTTKRYESRGVATAQFMSKRITVKESIISVLLKLHTKLGGSASYRPRAQQTSSSSKDLSGQDSELNGGDGQFYIAAFLDRLYCASSNASRIIDETCRSLNMNKVKAGPSESDKDSKRRKAWNRQQKLMAEFASKQKAFMESALDEGIASDSEDVASSSTPREEATKCQVKEYDCTICSQTTPSTGSRPVGLVVFLQASSVLGHRHQSDQEFSLNMSESQMQRYLNTSCGKVNKRKMDVLLKHFDDKSVELSVNIGWEGGVVAQTCGHYLHLDCHKSYLDSLMSQSHGDVLAVNKREYWCPLCRQLSNSVVPMLPEESRTMLVKPVSSDPHQMVLDIAEMMVKRRISMEYPTLTKAMRTAMEDLTHITYPSYRSFSSRLNTESILLFMSSVARTNLEMELLQRGCKLGVAAASSTGKKDCFLPLLHVLSLHSKVLSHSSLYPSLWNHITGVPTGENSTSLSVYEKQVPVLLKDPVSILIQFVLTLSHTIGSEHLDFVIQMLYNLSYVQALTYISCRFSNDERDAWRRMGRQCLATSLDGLLSNIISWLSRSPLYEETDSSLTLPAICQSVWSPQSVEQTVEEFCLPFLRTASLLKCHLFGLEVPNLQASESEFSLLVQFLHLGSEPSSDPATGVKPVSLSWSCVRWVIEEPHTLVRAWCQHMTDFVLAARHEAKNLLQLNPNWQRPGLIKLPKRYYQIFQMFRATKCSECMNIPKDPAICLTCRQFLCFRESCCIQNSTYESVAHSIACGAGTGMFLLVNSSLVVIIRGPRAALWGSVYLDEHGEEDRDLKRGRPLYLSMARYSLLESQWLSHSLDQACKRWVFHRDEL